MLGVLQKFLRRIIQLGLFFVGIKVADFITTIIRIQLELEGEASLVGLSQLLDLFLPLQLALMFLVLLSDLGQLDYLLFVSLVGETTLVDFSQVIFEEYLECNLKNKWGQAVVEKWHHLVEIIVDSPKENEKKKCDTNGVVCYGGVHCREQAFLIVKVIWRYPIDNEVFDAEEDEAEV